MRVVKELLDRLLAFLGLVLLSPVFAGLAFWIVLESGRPVIFRQLRAGRHAKTFSMLKFRTMVPNAVELGRELKLSDDPFVLLPNDPRITRSGRFLRRTSLDELPQLWNVLRGEMSLVGPRPIVPAEIRHYRDDSQMLLLLQPGITGLWQVSGRSNLAYPERTNLELEYVERWTLGRDLRILAATVPAVLQRRGAH